MERIELSRWEPSPEDPRRKQYAGQRTAQEVFEELKHRLEGMGYLPDEYFLMDRDWENGREIPRDADIFCTTDYGGSEGIYLDVSLQWYENDRTVTRNFITGKRWAKPAQIWTGCSSSPPPSPRHSMEIEEPMPGTLAAGNSRSRRP